MGSTARFLAFFLFVPFTVLFAQTPEPGQRIRVTAPDGGMNKQVFTFESWRGDSLLILGDAPLRVHLSSVIKIEVSRGQKSFGILKGAGFGFLFGAPIGGMLGGFGGEKIMSSAALRVPALLLVQAS